ncbi:hypothetical protein PRIPAC_81880 [Pristionchus pacificus]|uniref:G protein-coupled receptor n=1 Tax=Pristionchus pacificus TaxID=54126 RepID=A0A2A6C403_PRIPA|nr:hypothetical protein PRIPAC_81880 [Pristionchus pacificus]|eukprot:PDM72894.1 G protein-coupled receptor [Pristionchus pacificus]
MTAILKRPMKKRTKNASIEGNIAVMEKKTLPNGPNETPMQYRITQPVPPNRKENSDQFFSGFARSFTDYWTNSNWTCLGVVINIIYIAIFVGTCAIAFAPDDETRALAPKELEGIYGHDLRDQNRGYLVISVRRPDPATGHESIHLQTTLALILLVFLFGGTGCVILYCIWRINGIIRAPGNHLTTKTRKMQMDLFRALLIQSAIPMLFSYFPLGMILVFPAVSEPCETIFCLIFVATYYQTFLIISYHFVYRWKNMHRGYAVIAIRVGAYHNLKTSLSIQRPDPQSGEMLWHLPTTVSLMMLVCEFGGTSIIIVFCIWRITALIRSPNNHLTTKTRNMQQGTSFSGIAHSDSSAYSFLVHSPWCNSCLSCSFRNFSWCFRKRSFLSYFNIPIIDAFFVLFLIGRFRTADIRLFRLPFKTEYGSSVEQRSKQRTTGQMTDYLYSWVYQDPFHSIFFGVTTIISILSNSLLLYIIFTTSSSCIGSYRYLLIIFAICDIATSIAHAAVQLVSAVIMRLFS